MTDRVELAVAGATRLAERLRASAAALAPLRPIDAVRVDGLDERDAERCDAFLKRYENLVSQLQDQVWRQVLLAEGDDPNPLSRRDIIERMDRFGLVPNALAAREAAALCNRLAHAYPMQPALQAARLEEALAQVPVLLDCSARAEAWLARRQGGTAPAAPP